LADARSCSGYVCLFGFHADELGRSIRGLRWSEFVMATKDRQGASPTSIPSRQVYLICEAVLFSGAFGL
jgi:hypothetical protein